LKRAIEEDFPIVEINRLAAPERNAFKPVYQMHKWFARRASSVFRALLLGALKPAGTNIMEEFYKDHSKDSDTNGKVVLDPFMGGGTTVAEALRLGCNVIGVDLNPVAWFIVKTEVEPLELKEFDGAFERLANRTVPWSARPLRQTLLDLYKTAPPWTTEEVCGLSNSDVIYTFWAKSAICTSSTCRKQFPLFSDYVVATKRPSIRYYPDCKCPKCDSDFDWEVEPAALIADPRLMFHGNAYSGGVGRSNSRWTYAHEDGGVYVCQGKTIWTKGGNVTESSPEWIHVLRQHQVKTGMLEAGQVCCPQCHEIVRPRLTTKKKKRKKVPLTALVCPQTEDVFQWRGEIAEGVLVTSPAGFTFDPQKAHVTDKGRFVCPHCGNNDAIIASIRSLPEDQLLPMHAYGLQAYAPGCDPGNDPDERGKAHDELFGENGESEEMEDGEEETRQSDTDYSGPYVPPTHNLVWKQSGKFYARHTPADKALYSRAEALWQKYRDVLPYPKSRISSGQETDRLLEHHYRNWHQMFSSRQLLALATLLEGILREDDQRLREQLVLCLSASTDTNNLFSRYMASRLSAGGQTVQGVFARHDFQPKATVCEQNVWGLSAGGMGSFIRRYWQSRNGVAYAATTTDVIYTTVNGKRIRSEKASDSLYRNGLESQTVKLFAQSSKKLIDVPDASADCVITDPPYSDNVNYAELAEFYYVWQRLGLKDHYPHFLPDRVPTQDEVIKNKYRGKGDAEFGKDLMEVFRESYRVLKDDGILAFTFHHAEDSAWQALLDAVLDAGFNVEAIYPVHSEGESSLHLMDKEAISYDLIHVCRKRRAEDTRAKKSWAGLRQLVRQRAKEEIARIEAGRYGGQPLSPPDVRMVLIGKCLEVYSRHYGAVIDWNGEPFPLRSALQDIRMMVEQIVSKETPLPSELENVDAISQVWLLALCDKREVSVDSISKFTRGVFEVSDLTGHKPPLLRKGRVKGGRTYEVLNSSERLDTLRMTLRGAESTAEQLTLLTSTDNVPIVIGPELVDVIHLLAGNAEQGERLDQLVERFRGQREQIRAALHYLKQRDPDRWTKACDKLLPFYDDLFAQATLEKGNH
jgi:putative DNA methylase